MGIRKRLKPQEAEYLGFEVKPKDASGRNARYTLDEQQRLKLKDFRDDKKDEEKKKEHKGDTENYSDTTPNDYDYDDFALSAFNPETGQILSIQEYCEKYNMNYEDVTSYKFLPHHYKYPTYHIVFREQQKEIQEIDFESLFSRIVKDNVRPIVIKPYINKNLQENTFDRLVYTDVHVGMTPNENGYALYGGKWDEEELDRRNVEMCNFVIANKRSRILYIDDYGDLMDGWDGHTVRRDHKLPQNMDNEKAFDVALNWKIKQIDILIKHYEEIVVNNICEDNHSGSFGYVVNSAFKRFIEQKYANVRVNNHRKFINHYYVGKHCFVISHGKDSKNLKFGFKPVLDTKQIEKIDQYLKHHDIYRKAEFIEFAKGDSHQLIMDYATSDDFDYCNYLAFSPSSEWVQTNFKKGRSGFVFYTIDYDKNEKDMKIHYFN